MADASAWAKRVAAWRASGTTAEEFCADQDFRPGTLRWWSSRLARQAAATKAVATRSVPIARAVVRRRASPATGGAVAPTVVIEVAGTRVFVARGVDRETLSVVLDVLAQRRGPR